MYRIHCVYLLLVLILSGCEESERESRPHPIAPSQKNVERLGQFVRVDDNMWEASVDVHGSTVEVTLDTYGTDFETVAEYARSVISDQAISKKQIDEDMERGLRWMEQKFQRYEYKREIDVGRFKIKRMFFCRQLDGDELKLTINLSYPDDDNRWVLTYLGTDRGSLNWIPACAFED